MTFRREVLEDAGGGRPGAGRRFLAARQAHLAEQDIAELLRRAEIERRADELGDLVLEPPHALGKFARKARQHVAVDRDSSPLHARERLDERTFEPFIDACHGLGGETRLQGPPEAQDHVGVLGGVFACSIDRDPREADEVAARARDLAQRERLVAEGPLAERVQTVIVAGETAVERIGDQQGVVERRKGDPALRKRHRIELDVVTELENSRRLEQRLQQGQRLRFGDLAFDERASAEQVIGADAVPDRDIAGLAWLHRHRQADKLAPHRVDGRELRIHRHDAFRLRSGDPGGKLRRRPHGRISGAVDRRARLGRAGAGEVGGRGALRNGLWLQRRNGGSGTRRSDDFAFRRRFPFQEDHASTARPGPGADEARVRFDRGRIDAADFGDPLGERGELHGFEKGKEPFAVELRRRERFERRLDRHVPVQSDQLLRDPDALDILRLGQRLAPLRLLDLASAREQRFKIAVFENELRRGLEADAGSARNVVGRIAGKRLDVDNLVGPDALEISDNFLDAKAPLLARAGNPGLT